jgi:folate-binding Fe-S cluster repair protein YgfZ
MNQLPYTKILVSGEDAFDFLQAQLSNDLQLLETRDRLLSAWCNPKGRVICLMTVLRRDAGCGRIGPRHRRDRR